MRLTLGIIFGGLGAGCIVAAYLLSLAGGISKGDLILPDFAGGMILAIGLGCFWIPGNGRLRTISALRLTRTWITYETYAAISFFVALAALAKVSHPLIELLVAATAALYLVCQAYVIQAAKSRPAWRAPEMPSLIIVMGLAEGVGLIALISAIAPAIVRGATLAPIAGMVLAAMGAFRWRDYVSGQIAKQTNAVAPSNIRHLSLWIYALTYALPVTLYLAALVPWAGASWILPVSGVWTIAMGAVWTNTLIIRLGQARAFTASPIGL
jgi:phenylacetyl-CoA:acceptor oxidoreductase subunit 2